MKGHLDGENEGPPFLGRWRNVYLLIVGVLAVVGILFFLFTKHFE